MRAGSEQLGASQVAWLVGTVDLDVEAGDLQHDVGARERNTRSELAEEHKQRTEQALVPQALPPRSRGQDSRPHQHGNR